MRRTVLIITLASISLFSCSDVSDFLFETGSSVEVRSISSGALLSGGDSFPLFITADRTAVPDEYSVKIYDERGNSWGETFVGIDGSEDTASFSLVVPAELPPGKYLFHITVFEKNREIGSHDVTVFVTDGNYSINQLISIPHETGPGRDVFITADLSYPEESDPYLRWSINGEIAGEGLLSEGSSVLHWLSGDEPGMYTILLELFPGLCDASYISTVKDTVVIVVSDESLIDSGALLPEEAYTLLYHFDGNLNPVNPDDFVSSFEGKAGAIPESDSFLYTIDGFSGMSATGKILPSEEGKLTPFSLNGRIASLDPPVPGYVFRVRDGINDLIALTLEDSGHLSVTVNGSGSLCNAPLSGLTDFTIHFIPGEKNTEIRWFINGIPSGRDVLPTGPLFLGSPEKQRAITGGDSINPSAYMALDELGVFIGTGKISDVDRRQFSRVKSYQLGDNLIASDGYDGIAEGLRAVPGERKKIGSFAGTLRKMEIVLAMEPCKSGDAWSIVLENSDGSESYSIPRTPVFNDDKIRLTISYDGESGRIAFGSGAITEKTLRTYTPGKMFSLFLQAPVENNNDVILDYYIVYTITDSLLPDAVASAEEEENLL